MRANWSRILAACAVLASLLTSGCMVGPKYAKPAVPAAPAYKEQPPESFKAAEGWKPAQPQDAKLKGKWWELFGDPTLNDLEQQLEPANQSLKIALARYEQARTVIPVKQVGVVSYPVRGSWGHERAALS